jgi:hypothetical protein
MLDPVFFFFDHLIQTKMLPRKMASETFFAKFTEYCEKEGYPTPKDMETVTKIIDSFDHMGYMDRWVGPEIHFPDPEMFKKYLDKLVIESKCLLTDLRGNRKQSTKEVFLQGERKWSLYASSVK